MSTGDQPTDEPPDHEALGLGLDHDHRALGSTDAAATSNDGNGGNDDDGRNDGSGASDGEGRREDDGETRREAGGEGGGGGMLGLDLDPADQPALPPPSLLIGTKPSVLIPIAPGTNRNDELATAFRAAGAEVHQVPLQVLRSGGVKLVDHQLLALPGGFSYGDALGAGRLLGLDLSGWFAEQLTEAREREMPIIGICNGFQALVRAGLLPGPLESSGTPTRSFAGPGTPTEVAATLAENANGRFECRWVHLAPAAKWSPWTAELTEPIRCPVAHGEGRFVTSDLAAVENADLVAFRYCDAAGEPAAGAYPVNPNGSAGDVAGIVDPTGLVLGLMPHPEDHVFARQDPHWRRNIGGGCLGLFTAGVSAVAAS